MEVSGQIHTSAALPLGKEPAIPIGEEAGWDPESVWSWCRRVKFPTPVGNRTPIVQPVASRYTD
jgi:hypothetical protein